MELRKQCLMAWMSQITNTKLTSFKQLIDGTQLQILMSKCDDFNTIPDNQIEGWKGNYMKLKFIFKEIDSFFKQNLKSHFPNQLSSINLVEIAKGEDEDGIINLLTLIFIACIESSNKQKFINAIICLNENQQKDIMDLIQQCKLSHNDVSIEQENIKDKDQQKIKELIFYLQTLESQNQSLNQMILEETIKIKTLSERIQKLETQNTKLRKENHQILMKQRQEQINSSLIPQVLMQKNQEIIEELKATLFQQEEDYNKEMNNYKEKIQILEDKISQYHRKEKDFQSEMSTQLFYRQTDHSNCINIVQHNQKLCDLSEKIKQYSRGEWKAKMQIIKLKNTIEELKSQKIKLQATQNQNITYIDRSYAGDIKHQIMTKLRDTMKLRLQQMIKNKAQSKKSAIQKTDQLQILLLDSEAQSIKEQNSQILS